MTAPPRGPVLLDAYAVLAVLRGEPAARAVRPLLRRRGALVHPLNLAEVIDRLARLDGIGTDDVEADVALLGIDQCEPHAAALVEAGRLRARHYHRTKRPVSLADCVAAAHALQEGYSLATSDAPLAALVREEGGAVRPLPNSDGELPA